MSIKTFKKLIKNNLICVQIKLKRYSLNNAIIITSESRSGSTWLMEFLGNFPGTILNWEPLNVENGLVPKTYKFGARPLISSTDNSKYLIRLFEDILTLKQFNTWTISFVKFKKIFSSKYVVTKFVRANSLLPWLTSNFKLKYKPILLLRHPITTCISQLKNFNKEIGSSISEPISNFIEFKPPDCINNERYVKFQNYINSLKTPLERQIALWCVNNHEVICNPNSEKWITIYYEDIVLKPEEEFAALLKKLDLPFTAQNFKNVDFKKPSRSNFLGEYNRNATIQLELFLKEFDDVYLTNIQAIFDHFKIVNYSAFSAYPTKN